MNEIKEFTSDKFDYVTFAQTFDGEISYIVAVKSQEGAIGTSTFFDLDGNELFPVDGFIQEVMVMKLYF